MPLDGPVEVAHEAEIHEVTLATPQDFSIPLERLGMFRLHTSFDAIVSMGDRLVDAGFHLRGSMPIMVTEPTRLFVRPARPAEELIREYEAVARRREIKATLEKLFDRHYVAVGDIREGLPLDVALEAADRVTFDYLRKLAEAFGTTDVDLDIEGYEDPFVEIRITNPTKLPTEKIK